MSSPLEQLPPEGLLRAAVDALLGEDPRQLDPEVALCRATVLQHEVERLAAAALASIADVDERELFALDGAGSTRSWLKQQPAGDQGQLSLARRLRTRPTVRAALEAGTVSTRAAASVCTALVGLDDVETSSPLSTPIAESQVVGVLLHCVPDLLCAWTGYAVFDGRDELPAEDTDLRNEVLGRRALLARVLTDAAEAVGGPTSDRLEPIFTVLARALSPHQLADALTTILNALQPERLESEEELFLKELGWSLTKRRTRGWDLKAVLDDEDGELLNADLRARMQALLARTPDPGARENEGPTTSIDRADTAPTGNPSCEPVGQDGGPWPASAALGGTPPGVPGTQSPPEAAGATGEALSPSEPPGLFDQDHGLAGPGIGEPLPWSAHALEGPAGAGLGRNVRYDALRALLTDSRTRPGTTTAARLTVVVTAAFLAGVPGAPHPQLDGRRTTELTRAALNRLGCDGTLAAVVLDAAGQPIAASGEHRNATARERRALRAQWGNCCAVNGCGTTATVPHHVEMWALVHHTRLRDLVPLCVPHHRDVHEGKRTLRLRDGRLIDESGWVEARLDAVA